MLGYLTLVAWTVNASIGLWMHGVKRFPIGVVLAHASIVAVGYVAWITYLASDRPLAVGWFAVIWLLVANGLGDAAVVRRWKKKADGGKGLVGTYLQRIKRPALLSHAVGAGVTTGLAIITVLTA